MTKQDMVRDLERTPSTDLEPDSPSPPRYADIYDPSYGTSHDPERVVDGAGVPYNIREDGRVDLNFNSRFIRTFSKCFPSGPDEDSQAAPPVYNTEPTVGSSAPPYQTWKIKLNIVIQVVGSRGDVQPFMALGTELQRYGHRVRLATHDTFASFVRTAGLEFYPIGGDPASLMAYMVKNPSLMPSMKTMVSGEISRKRRMVSEMLSGCWDSCVLPDPLNGKPFVADAIIANPPSFAHIHCAQALGIPVHLMFTMPWTGTRAFPHPLANLTNVDGSHGSANRLSYHLVDWMTWQGLGDVIDDWRGSIQLEPINLLDGPTLVKMLKIPFTYCWSSALVPKPSDWPDYIDVCGFFFRDTPAYEPEQGLVEFLAAGPPPIYIGFGSIVLQDFAQILTTILDAVRFVGVRAVISKGWSNLIGKTSDNVYYIDDCPHEWLFARMAAVVHHGGAGTTACGLRNGLPTLICPFFGDQPFWGHMIAQSGAGPEPLPPRKMTAAALVEAIQFLLREETLAAAKAIARRMENEQGVRSAVESFHRHLPIEQMQCDLIPDQPAVWTLKSGRKPVKVSKVAGEILVSQWSKMRKELRTHQTKPISIEPIRWDPLSGMASAVTATLVDMAGCLTGMVTEPIKIYGEERRQQTRDNRSSSSVNSQQLERVDTPKTSNASIHTLTSTKSRNRPSAGGKAAIASVKSLAWFPPKVVKGISVDIPLALAEGLHKAPKYYGDEVREHGKVTGAGSGLAVGGKSLAWGLMDGLSGLGMLPYKDYKKFGAVGIATGFGKGVAGIVTKPAAGAIGAFVHPVAGLAKSFRSAVYNQSRKLIDSQRAAEGQWLIEHQAWSGSEVCALMEKFKALGSK